MNTTQDSCVLTYPTPFLIAYNTTVMMHIKTKIPDDGLCKPKHVAANITGLNVLTVSKLQTFVCISWG